MADNNDLHSDEQGKSFLARLLLLLLFLLLLCLAGGYYFLGNNGVPTAEKQPTARPLTPDIPGPAPPPAALAPTPARQLPEKGTASKPAGLEPVEGEAGKPAPRLETAAAETPVAPPPGPEPVELSAPAPRPHVPDRYVLQGPPFLGSGNLAKAEQIVRSLGFEPRLEKGEKTVRMTRLLVGRYPLAQARARLRQLKGMAPGVFLLPQGKRTALYAGSFADARRARDLAARLNQQGVRVEEEPVEVSLAVTILTFGDYPDMATAGQAAERARANGLEVRILRRP